MKNFILASLLLFVSQWGSSQQDFNYFLSTAKENSPLINKTKNEIAINSLDLKQIKSILSEPNITLDANVYFAPIINHDNNANHFEWVSQDATDYYGYDLANTNGGTYAAGVSYNQPLFKSSLFSAYAEKTDILKQSNLNTIDLTEHELEQLVAYQYILCLKSKKQTETSKEILKQVSDQINIMETLVDNAVYRQTDLMLLQLVYSNYEIDYKTYSSEYEKNYYDLNLICGIKDSTLYEISDIAFSMHPDTLTQSRFYQKYRLDSLAILSDQSINDMRYKPQLSFYANAGLSAAYLPAVDRLGFSTGLTFSWILYDGHQREIQKERSEIRINSVEIEKNYFKRQQTIQKNKISNQIFALEERKRLIEKNIKQYNKLIESYQNEIAYGQISIIDLKNLFQELTNKKQDALLIEMERQSLISAYNYWYY